MGCSGFPGRGRPTNLPGSTWRLRQGGRPAPDRRGPRHHRVHREVSAVVRAYELMVIFDGDLEEGAFEANVNKVTEAITAEGGTVQSTDKWGKRRFAYEIAHKTEGWYVVQQVTT